MSRYIVILLFSLLAIGLTASRRPIHVNTPTQKEKNDLKWWNDSKAAILTSRSFEGLVGKDKFVVVQFCATFSKECEALQPEYNKLADLYTGATPKHADVFIGKIDGWTFNSLSQEYSVKRFPTIRFFNKNDAKNSEEYNGEVTADAISKWIEDTIKAKETPKTEEKKPEEPKKEEAAKEAPKETPKEAAATETKQPEAANTNAQQNNQQQQQQTQQTQQTQPPKTEEELKKEFKLVLNTTLLQGQFDEVQNQLNKLGASLTTSIAENFKKVEALNQVLEAQKRDIQALSDNIRNQGDKINQVSNSLNAHRDDIKNSITRHTQEQLSSVRDTTTAIRNKVFEKKIEEPTGPGFLHNLIYIIIGGAIGAGVMHFLGGGNKKRRAMLD